MPRHLHIFSNHDIEFTLIIESDFPEQTVKIPIRRRRTSDQDLHGLSLSSVLDVPPGCKTDFFQYFGQA